MFMDGHTTKHIYMNWGNTGLSVWSIVLRKVSVKKVVKSNLEQVLAWQSGLCGGVRLSLSGNESGTGAAVLLSNFLP